MSDNVEVDYEFGSLKKTDSAIRFLFASSSVRGVWVNLHDACQNVMAQKNYTGAEKILLGESLAAVVLLSRTIKLQGRLALQARGDGALGLLVAESTQDAGVRGVITLTGLQENESLPSLKMLVGDGYLSVTLLPDVGESYQGIVPLQGERLQDCLADYFSQSEQLPTAIWLASDGNSAAGLMLQALPSEDEKSAAIWQHLHILANTVTQSELLELPCEELLHRLFHQEDLQFLGFEPVRFQCTCSEVRSRNAIALLGRDDLQKLFAEQPIVVADCQFCGSQYRFTAHDVAEILGEIPSQVH